MVEQYKFARGRSAKLVKSSTKEYEMSLATDKKNPKRLFSYINSKQSTRVGIMAMNDTDDETRTNSTDIANVLNNHFGSVFVKDAHEEVLPVFELPSPPNVLEYIKIERQVVKNKLESLVKHKAIGVDGVSPYVLNECSDGFSLPLTLLFNMSIEQGSLPSAWLEANVTPIFKKGSRLDPSNYRPVSLTSVICRVLESIVRDEMMNHLIKNDLISHRQHGFVPKKACVTNLLETVDFVTNNLHEKTPTDIIFLDFSKAFDKVSHRRLLLKLEAYGFKGQIHSWLSAFLSNRRQRVVLGDSESSWTNVLSGVPQGSVLGPMLFIVYINDLASKIDSVCKLFADDCKIMASLNSVEDVLRLQQDLDNVLAWCIEWKMVLNLKKCHVMHFGKKNTQNDTLLGMYRVALR